MSSRELESIISLVVQQPLQPQYTSDELSLPALSTQCPHQPSNQQSHHHRRSHDVLLHIRPRIHFLRVEPRSPKRIRTLWVDSIAAGHLQPVRRYAAGSGIVKWMQLSAEGDEERSEEVFWVVIGPARVAGCATAAVTTNIISPYAPRMLP